MTDARLRVSKLLPAGLVAAALWLLPSAALACPVCGGAQKPAVGRAYLFGGIIISQIPLIVAGLFAWWLRRRALALARPVRAPEPAAVGVPAASRS